MKRSSGFTLIELMVVIGIMILLASIVVTGSFGMSRASGYMAAESVVYNTLQAARQKACTDGKRVLVAFIKIEADTNTKIDDYSIVMAEAAGTIGKRDAKDHFYDRTSTLVNYQDMRSEDSIWNLDTGYCAPGPFTNYVSNISDDTIIPSAVNVGAYSYSPTIVKLLAREGKTRGDEENFSKWNEGEAYGFQIGETQEIPMGFKFKVNGSADHLDDWRIRFEPDGRSFFLKNGRVSGDSGTIEIYEEITKDDPHPITITVDKGIIKVKKPSGR